MILNKYGKLLNWSVLNRYLVATLSICVLLLSIVYASTRLPFQLFGEVEIGQFFVNVETPNTYSLDDSLELAETLEKKITHEISIRTIANTIKNYFH